VVAKGGHTPGPKDAAITLIMGRAPRSVAWMLEESGCYELKMLRFQPAVFAKGIARDQSARPRFVWSTASPKMTESSGIAIISHQIRLDAVVVGQTRPPMARSEGLYCSRATRPFRGKHWC